MLITNSQRLRTDKDKTNKKSYGVNRVEGRQKLHPTTYHQGLGKPYHLIQIMISNIRIKSGILRDRINQVYFNAWVVIIYQP